jgi:hypothetical protein
MTGANRKRRTIVALPRVKAGEGSEQKNVTLRKLLPSLGRATKSTNAVTTTHRGSEGDITALDLVKTEGRDGARGWLERNKDKETMPDVVFVQNLFREGANWPAAERYIVMGPRGSLPMLIQMIGRLLRNYEGKSYVEFHIILLESEIQKSTEDCEKLVDTVFQVMALGWQFTVGLNLPDRVRNQRALKSIIDGCKKKVFEGAPGESAGETMREILRNAIEGTAPSKVLEKGARSLLACLGPAFKQALPMAAGWTRNVSDFGTRLETDPFNAGPELLQKIFRAEHFKSLRGQFVGLPEITPEYTKQVIILHRCKYFQEKGQYVDPRTIPGLVAYFGSEAALDKACRAEGL